MEYKHCLRIAILPDENQDERISSVLEFCKKYKIQNVMLFINAEEFNVGHMTIEAAKDYVFTMKKAKKVFNDNGISVSLNSWITIGHLARGRRLAKNQNFIKMVDMHGLESNLVACPLCGEWKKYFFDFSEYLIKELEPEVFWVEDDFRLHNHYPLEYGGCFCEKHMEEYNKYLNTNYSREEFVEKVFAKGGLNKEREAFFEIARKTMSNLAKDMGDFVKKINPKTEVALMSSLPHYHCVEARDWEAVTNGLSAGGKKMNRIHLPCYGETCGKSYGFQFSSTSMLVRAMLDDEVQIYPELENASFSTYSKDARFLGFQIQTSMPLLSKGITYDIYDFVGNGTIESFMYGQEIERLSPYLNAFVDLDVKFSSLDGVIIPFDEKASYYRSIKCNGAWKDLLPDEFQIAGYLSGMGINYKFDKVKNWHNKTVMLCGNSVNYFSDIELCELFRDNFVVLDGGAILKLKERNLGNLIGMKDAEIMYASEGKHSYEEAKYIEGINNYRASSQEKAGDYVKVTYEDVVTLSTVKNCFREMVGNGIVKGQNFMVNPYIIKGIPYSSCLEDGCQTPYMEQFNKLRVEILKNILLSEKTDTKLFMCDYSGVMPFAYVHGNKVTVILLNSTVQNLDELKVYSNFNIKKIQRLNKDGSWSTVEFDKVGNKYTIHQKVEYLSSEVFVVEIK